MSQLPALIPVHRRFLVDNMNAVDSGLTARLYRDAVLSLSERDEIASTDLSEVQRNDKLLTIISHKTHKQDSKLFVDALRDTGQQHIADVFSCPPSRPRIS